MFHFATSEGCNGLIWVRKWLKTDISKQTHTTAYNFNLILRNCGTPLQCYNEFVSYCAPKTWKFQKMHINMYMRIVIHASITQSQIKGNIDSSRNNNLDECTLILSLSHRYTIAIVILHIWFIIFFLIWIYHLLEWINDD